MLISMLNSHPAILARGEIFQRLKGRQIQVILRRVFSRQPRNIKAVGFKIFYYHPLDDDSGKIWDELCRDEDLIVIHLTRRNLLRTEVSRKIAGKIDFWELEQGKDQLPVENRRVSFTEDELRQGFETTRGWEQEYSELFGRHKTIDVHYEGLVEDPRADFITVLRTMNLKYSEPKVTTKKQNPEKLSELVTNYESLKQAFVATQWSDYFED